MSDGSIGLIETLNAYLGGALTMITAATVGRLMHHSHEVSKKRRKFFGVELLIELPTAVGMGLIGDALGSYLGLGNEVRVGLVAVLGYLGPRGAETLIASYMDRKNDKPN